ncbi:NADPH-dependent FMN reductase [Desulfosporosinus acidiphilus SJ4]|uniref:NADPH-dependent FMN reductase n=1 Tax=Desulfosporosinus acidiphilus (strain DSM 22704 / JCM 16185 / SJ4) TaxID=646529 RepID=I4D1M9_DESAJ|nr:flavodoxin family protein [Desulfosporosinus acidiphilus]AFM39703.1 NADPH-dependent FMN reductase [Desulfosporosinus acidiphilus SJ4]
MPLSVLGIACSPRRSGNTTRLLLEAKETIVGEGHNFELIYLSDLKVNPCQGCNACSISGVCIIKDDISKLQDKLISADRIMIAAPIFMMGVNAQTKILIDRMQVLWARKYVLNLPLINSSKSERRGLFLSTAGTKKPDVFKCAERSIQTFFHMLGIKYDQPCLYSGIDRAGEILDHPTALEDIRKAAEALLRE